MMRDEHGLVHTMNKYALGSTEAMILILLQQSDKGPPDHCRIGDRAIQAYFHLSASRVACIIRRFKDLGLIKRVGKAHKPRKLEVVQDVQIRNAKG